MNSVITVNLGGNAYQLDEAGHAKLRAYLDAAALSLADNPDKTEILADIEAAIGDKCRLSLNPHKTVVTEADIDDILSEMGPVASGQDDNTHADTHAEKEKAPPSPKRLYRISEGSMWAGVCTGLAAYFDIDVTIIRLIFVILTFVTSGGFILAYFVMAVVVPKAATPEEYRAASRAEPVTAQALIDRAQEGYTNFKNSKEWRQWKHTMRHQAKQWGQQWNHQRRHAGYQGPATPLPSRLGGRAGAIASRAHVALGDLLRPLVRLPSYPARARLS